MSGGAESKCGSEYLFVSLVGGADFRLIMQNRAGDEVTHVVLEMLVRAAKMISS